MRFVGLCVDGSANYSSQVVGLHVAYLPISGPYFSRCLFLTSIFEFNVSCRCNYSWYTATTPGPQRSRSESRRLLLTRDYSWPVTPVITATRRNGKTKQRHVKTATIKNGDKCGQNCDNSCQNGDKSSIGQNGEEFWSKR